MVIKRSDLGSIDFSDIDTGDSIPEIHPGEILRSEFLEPLGMSVNALALALRVPAPRINDVVRGKRAVRGHLRNRAGRAIPYCDGMAVLQQVAGNALAHLAQADHTDLHHQ